MREAGTDKYDEVGFSRALRGAKAAAPGGGFSGHVGLALLRGKEGELAELMAESLFRPKLEGARPKLRQIARESRAAAESAARSSGNAIAASRIGAALTFEGWVSEQLGGLDRARTLPALCEQLDDDAQWPVLLARLRSLHARLLGGSEAVFSLSADEDSLAPAKLALQPLLASLATAATLPAVVSAATDATATAANAAAALLLADSLPASLVGEGLLVSASVSHIAVGGVLRLAGSPMKVTGSALVCTRLLRTGHLWQRVRVQGGAYGSGASLDRGSGALTLTSYRDPTPAGTLAAFREAGAALRTASVELDSAELERLVI
ncbi:hypothetical protein T492DRAFT_896977, partial [Pavlovales sp. CCMP2436]